MSEGSQPDLAALFAMTLRLQQDLEKETRARLELERELELQRELQRQQGSMSQSPGPGSTAEAGAEDEAQLLAQLTAVDAEWHGAQVSGAKETEIAALRRELEEAQSERDRLEQEIGVLRDEQRGFSDGAFSGKGYPGGGFSAASPQAPPRTSGARTSTTPHGRLKPDDISQPFSSAALLPDGTDTSCQTLFTRLCRAIHSVRCEILVKISEFVFFDDATGGFYLDLRRGGNAQNLRFDLRHFSYSHIPTDTGTTRNSMSLDTIVDRESVVLGAIVGNLQNGDDSDLGQASTLEFLGHISSNCATLTQHLECVLADVPAATLPMMIAQDNFLSFCIFMAYLRHCTQTDVSVTRQTMNFDQVYGHLTFDKLSYDCQTLSAFVTKASTLLEEMKRSCTAEDFERDTHTDSKITRRFRESLRAACDVYSLPAAGQVLYTNLATAKIPLLSMLRRIDCVARELTERSRFVTSEGDDRHIDAGADDQEFSDQEFSDTETSAIDSAATGAAHSARVVGDRSSDRFRQEEMCRRCQQPGHFARNCPWGPAIDAYVTEKLRRNPDFLKRTPHTGASFRGPSSNGYTPPRRSLARHAYEHRGAETEEAADETEEADDQVRALSARVLDFVDFDFSGF
jgi:hypothetical protein